MAQAANMAEAEDGVGALSKLPVILWERRWFIIVPTLLAGIAGSVAAFVIPPAYESRAVLLVESDELSEASQARAAQGESEIDRRMAKIRQQILSRPDLVELIQKHNLYNASEHRATLSQLVDNLRGATAIEAVNADIGGDGKGRRGASSIAFALSFRYPKPVEAQLVAQTFVDRLLKLDASQVQAQAANTARYLQDQQSTLQQQLSGIEAQIQRVAGANGIALSGGGGSTINLGGNYESQIAALQRENAQLRAATGSGAVDADPGVVQAQAALAAAKAQYSDDHPDVRLAEIRLQAARNAAAQQSGRSALAQQQIATNNAAIAELNRARNAQMSQAAAAAAAAARGPLAQQQVQQLQAQADLIRANLGKISSQLLSAQSDVKMAEEQRGERLSLIDPPVVADSPNWPNRPLFILGGFAGGLGLGLMLALLIEAFLRPIRSVGALTKIVGEPPLAVVPILSKRRFKPKWKLFGGRRGASHAN